MSRKENKFKKDKDYKNLCPIMSPIGLIKQGTILTGEQWTEVLVYDIGNSFKLMFEVVPKTQTYHFIDFVDGKHVDELVSAVNRENAIEQMKLKYPNHDFEYVRELI